jgi:trk system potassium uptake protein
MKIVVIGAGQVGRSVAVELAKTHDITVVDSESERLDALRFVADVLTLEGDGADLDVLQEAGVADADIIIASTDNDRVNILVCGIARMLKETLFTIARVADTAYLRSWERTRKAFQVDLMVASNYLTAVSIASIVSEQLAREIEYFDDGRIEMAEFRVPADSPLANKKVKDCNVPSGLRFAAVFTGDAMEVAGGDTIVKAGSRLLVIGRTQAVGRFGQELRGEPQGKRPRRGIKKWLTARSSSTSMSIFILGGDEVGYQIARLLEERGMTPKIVEPDPVRAEYLASHLPRTFVLNDSPRDPEFLKTEGIGRADLVIAAMWPDELNLFVSLQAIMLGAKRVVSVVHDKKYEELFGRNGVELTFNPRTEVIEEIIRHTRGRRLEKVAFIEDHRGEVIEVKLDKGSFLVGKSLEEATRHLPAKMVVGAVSRGGEVMIPHGKTVLREGDDLVIFVDAAEVDAVMEHL